MSVSLSRPAPPPWVRYGLAVLFVAAATVLAFVVDQLVAPPSLALIFVLPVVVAAARLGWGPALVAVAGGALAFDFLFTEPRFSFRISSPADVWDAALLLVIATIVSSIAADARRRAIEAERAAGQARALQGLAHVVIEDRPMAEVFTAAAEALHGLFGAPAAVFLDDKGAFGPVATAGGATITRADEDAARGALDTHVATRSEAYPYDQTEFDFWPVATPGGLRAVVGVDFTKAEEERPAAPERLVDIVRGYLTAAFAAGRG
ncbi:DUF4118 domain-containing protein [Caulobacter sp. 17J80-11]|uniref:DUF4118 domain-containing protein n=1 Tax=Caulobacter sp. 17J80-11 TaxID=2763502 RepID=UPI001653B71B|nr:DUF4118 domain-containing protein [Caulobacter sp. 17J80-11]MBC6983786.1 DUF4118 domain-containing protein [Caulobacter sp. 17J80-11]